MSSTPSDKNPISKRSVQVSDFLPIVLNPDDTITRLREFPIAPASPDPPPTLIGDDVIVLSKDVTVNPHRNTWVRLFLPYPQPKPKKLPVIVYIHGGGFILCSAATAGFHNFCVKIALQIEAIVVSVEYRLAPEHRLPAAYDDAVDSLHWIKSSTDDWLRKFADLSNCFLMGTSSGGNIAFHAGLRSAATVNDLSPLKINGLLLHEPYFGGYQRSESELRLINDQILPLIANDVQWKLSLPIGADRDHEYCNPTVACESEMCDRMRLMNWRVVVTGCDGDPLVDRQRELVRGLEKKGVAVVGMFSEGGFHGFEMRDPTKAKKLLMALKHFVHSPSITRSRSSSSRL